MAYRAKKTDELTNKQGPKKVSKEIYKEKDFIVMPSKLFDQMMGHLYDYEEIISIFNNRIDCKEMGKIITQLEKIVDKQ